MGLYQSRVVPRLVDWTCGTKGLAKWRTRACAGLSGTVLEVGFGSGHNVPYYPATVERVLAVDPATRSRALARQRVAQSPIPIEYVGLDGQALALDDDSCDAALVTFTLCTIPDPSRALAEIARVLRPGAELHFLEHGRAPDAKVARWQERIDPWERRLADGCHLTREPLNLITDAGFELVSSKERYARGPKPWSYFTIGVARTPPERPGVGEGR